MNDKELLVEGNDDQHVIWAICREYAVPESFKVIDTKGIDNLINQLTVRLKQSHIKTIGIVLDADADINNRWTSVKDKIGLLINEVPAQFPTDGLIIANDKLRIGVWIMPNNQVSGMLEDFIAYLIPPDDKLHPEVKRFLTELEEKDLSNYKDIHRAKALIHNWLSLQESPGTPMGLAITKKYLNANDANCSRFVNWLNTLFNPA